MDGWFGVITGSCSLIPGFGIVLGLLSRRFIEIPLLEKREEQLCPELVDIYLPQANTDLTDETPKYWGIRPCLERCRRQDEPIRDQDSGVFRKSIQLLGKTLLPFGIGPWWDS